MGDRSMPASDDRQRERIASMVARFRDIGARNMHDLPIYNHELQVEAIGFRLFGDNLIGVLITPWFMNFIMLPRDKVDMDLTAVGRKVEIALPSGTWTFTAGGDRIIGAYQALSLHSPVLNFKTQELARIEAQRRFNALMTAPSMEESAGPPEKDASIDQGRRAFFRGRSAAAPTAEAKTKL